jgi:hypothetical protein
MPKMFHSSIFAVPTKGTHDLEIEKHPDYFCLNFTVGKGFYTLTHNSIRPLAMSNIMDNLSNLQFEYEFAIEEGFDCNPEKMPCGLCCSMPFAITCSEINRINDFLEKWLYTPEFEDFALDNATYYKPLKAGFPKSPSKEFRADLQSYFKPCYFFEKEDTLIVWSHRLSYHYITRKCIFFNPISFKCMIHGVRPFECQFYPYNFEYDFNKNKVVSVFITQRCDGFTNAKSFQKETLEKTIKDYLVAINEQNLTLKRLEEEIKIPLSHPIEVRKVRNIQDNFAHYAEEIDKIHVSKRSSHPSKIRDIFLEKKLINCLNEELYKSYLAQILKNDIKSVWE